ncbi:Xaa-Pro dipeptidase [Dokdonella fugitiva]|uniref:Xaa-Pro dipeptidase n=1 Tax=Dokdonella fugitiva TaxID=328517 RepID=A0A839F2P1_9GAMM|nr:Xaa-Pro peptidase family protein [Dokdonella fugitiva]MBA8888302.1 Xaa-Pro dipeptidase [Dokdonella fugitiva]
MDRRRFFSAGASAALMGLADSRASAGDRADIAKTHFDAAAVKALRDRIRPIAADEYRARQENARRLMKENGLDAVFVEGGTTLSYFTGLHWWLSERLFAMVLPQRGEPFFIAPKFEEGRAREKLGSEVKVYTWEEHEKPIERIRQGLQDRGLLTAKLGIEETTRYYAVEQLQQRLSTLTLSSATPVTAGCRGMKSPHEIELMQVANDITAQVYRQVQRELREGMSETELGGIISARYAEFGVEGDALVLFGEASAYPHGLTRDVALKDGDVVLIDGGCKVEGYGSDITRTMAFGKPSAKMQRVFEIVRGAQDAGLKAARPGVAAEKVDAAARSYIADHGYGPGYTYFTHRLGHGIGMDGHEWYYLVGGNTRALAPGNLFSNEPGIYIVGEFGIRTEDEMLITDDGARLLLPQAKSLQEIF